MDEPAEVAPHDLEGPLLKASGAVSLSVEVRLLFDLSQVMLLHLLLDVIFDEWGSDLQASVGLSW